MRSLVVDADVARSSSQMPATDQALAATNALQVLEGAKDIGFLFDDQLTAEWLKHQSKLASTWLANQERRGRTKLRSCNRAAFDTYIDSTKLQQTEKTARKKDTHLLALSLQNQAPVVSGDLRSRNGFRAFCSYAPPWQDVEWFQLGEDDQALQDWCAGSTIAPRLCP